MLRIYYLLIPHITWLCVASTAMRLALPSHLHRRSPIIDSTEPSSRNVDMVDEQTQTSRESKGSKSSGSSPAGAQQRGYAFSPMYVDRSKKQRKDENRHISDLTVERGSSGRSLPEEDRDATWNREKPLDAEEKARLYGSGPGGFVRSTSPLQGIHEDSLSTPQKQMSMDLAEAPPTQVSKVSREGSLKPMSRVDFDGPSKQISKDRSVPSSSLVAVTSNHKTNESPIEEKRVARGQQSKVASRLRETVKKKSEPTKDHREAPQSLSKELEIPMQEPKSGVRSRLQNFFKPPSKPIAMQHSPKPHRQRVWDRQKQRYLESDEPLSTIVEAQEHSRGSTFDPQAARLGSPHQEKQRWTLPYFTHDEGHGSDHRRTKVKRRELQSSLPVAFSRISKRGLEGSFRPPDSGQKIPSSGMDTKRQLFRRQSVNGVQPSNDRPTSKMQDRGDSPAKPRASFYNGSNDSKNNPSTISGEERGNTGTYLSAQGSPMRRESPGPGQTPKAPTGPEQSPHTPPQRDSDPPPKRQLVKHRVMSSPFANPFPREEYKERAEHEHYTKNQIPHIDRLGNQLWRANRRGNPLDDNGHPRTTTLSEFYRAHIWHEYHGQPWRGAQKEVHPHPRYPLPLRDPHEPKELGSDTLTFRQGTVGRTHKEGVWGWGRNRMKNHIKHRDSWQSRLSSHAGRPPSSLATSLSASHGSSMQSRLGGGAPYYIYHKNKQHFFRDIDRRMDTDSFKAKKDAYLEKGPFRGDHDPAKAISLSKLRTHRDQDHDEEGNLLSTRQRGPHPVPSLPSRNSRLEQSIQEVEGFRRDSSRHVEPPLQPHRPQRSCDVETTANVRPVQGTTNGAARTGPNGRELPTNGRAGVAHLDSRFADIEQGLRSNQEALDRQNELKFRQLAAREHEHALREREFALQETQFRAKQAADAARDAHYRKVNHAIGWTAGGVAVAGSVAGAGLLGDKIGMEHPAPNVTTQAAGHQSQPPGSQGHV